MPTAIPTSPSTAPFVIGVAAKTDLTGYSDCAANDSGPAKDLALAIASFLQWVRAKPGTGKMDFATGSFGAQSESGVEPLGLEKTPVVILCSLGPGVETVVAEAVLKYLEEHDDSTGITIRCVLPFPAAEYADCSLFKSADGNLDLAKWQRLQDLKTRLGADGWHEGTDWFIAPLDPALATIGVTADTVLPGSGSAAIHPVSLSAADWDALRLCAAGEFVASYCDLLIAVTEPATPVTSRPTTLYPSDCATIVKAKRNGAAWRLLAESSNFTWADNGPVLQFSLDSQAEPGAPAKLAFLHSEDLRPRSGSGDQDDEWQEKGDSVFRKILALQEEFNSAPLDDPGFGALDELLENKEGAGVDPESAKAVGRNFALDMVPLAKVWKRADRISNDRNRERKLTLKILIFTIGVAALFLGFFEHWHPKSLHHSPPAPATAHANPAAEHADPHAAGDHHQSQENPHGSVAADHHEEHAKSLSRAVRVTFLSLTILLVVVSIGAYLFYHARHSETKRFDSRAISEALRVQFYWNLAGQGSSVASNYMLRQRDELDWIRYVVSSVSFPSHRWKENFDKLNRPKQIALLKLVRELWFDEQKSFFISRITRLHDKVHFWHVLAWGLTWAGCLQIFNSLLEEIVAGSPAEKETWKWYLLAVFAVFAIPFVVALYRLIRALTVRGLASLGSSHSHGHRLIDQWEISGIAAAIGSAAYLLPCYLPKLSEHLPARLDWWIILTGACLLSGALSLTWSERNFYSELHRQYSAMGSLYACASRRLQVLITRLSGSKEGMEEHLLMAEIRDLFYNVGCEALDENAEWLILHRARPLEPFMAG